MIKGNKQIFGEELFMSNTHWIKTYAGVLTMLSEINMKDTIPLLDIPPDDETTATRIVSELMIQHAHYIEGYTLREVTEWFVDFCKTWHKENGELRLKNKKIILGRLKQEIKDLEQEINTLEK